MIDSRLRYVVVNRGRCTVLLRAGLLLHQTSGRRDSVDLAHEYRVLDQNSGLISSALHEGKFEEMVRDCAKVELFLEFDDGKKQYSQIVSRS